MRSIISFGNTKLNTIFNFNLPAVTTCPGATQTCLDACYANKRRYKWDNIKSKYEFNLRLSRNAEKFTTALKSFLILNDELDDSRKIMRIHTSGDFYSNEYIKAWQEIVGYDDSWTFYGYTRSWRCDNLIDELNVLRNNDNVNIFASTDKDSGEPPKGWLEAAFLKAYSSEYKECHRDMHCDQCRHCLTGAGNVCFMKSI
ncbi:hypothetical protein HNP86_001844 [Methanococcus maripaludis]|uniref:Gene product 88 domain-containing protein n=1 Tax=Methanococcus maripaludis TaxID=39152 RepID=A0A7J9NWQ9_METMI|nr:hypothetical protein [Methanococcus maripaludis]MBA2851685.1 hypothetical protein [Methanococcus maripaludis]